VGEAFKAKTPKAFKFYGNYQTTSATLAGRCGLEQRERPHFHADLGRGMSRRSNASRYDLCDQDASQRVR